MLAPGCGCSNEGAEVAETGARVGTNSVAEGVKVALLATLPVALPLLALKVLFPRVGVAEKPPGRNSVDEEFIFCESAGCWLFPLPLPSVKAVAVAFMSFFLSCDYQVRCTSTTTKIKSKKETRN